MAHKDLSPHEIRQRLWKELAEIRIVMLGLTGENPDHMQPMAAFGDNNDAIWFFTNRSTDLAKETGSGHDAIVSLVSKDMEFQASIQGHLVPDHNQAMINRFWSPFVAAWFPHGKDDPELTLLRLACRDARVWMSTKGSIGYLLEIAKANLRHKVPDIEQKAGIELATPSAR
jgi:general stress protein 26